MRGKIVIGVMFGVAVTAATFAVWYSHAKTHRVISQLGPDAVRLIVHAPQVEFLTLGTLSDATFEAMAEDIATGDGMVHVLARTRIDQAPGLTHLRHALRQDVSYRWDNPDVDKANWAHGLRFIEREQQVTLVFDVQAGMVEIVDRGVTLRLGEKMVRGIEKYFDEITNWSNSDPADQ